MSFRDLNVPALHLISALVVLCRASLLPRYSGVWWYCAFHYSLLPGEKQLCQGDLVQELPEL